MAIERFERFQGFAVVGYSDDCKREFAETVRDTPEQAYADARELVYGGSYLIIGIRPILDRESCPRCRGEGKYLLNPERSDGEITCPSCRGAGQVVVAEPQE